MWPCFRALLVRGDRLPRPIEQPQDAKGTVYAHLHRYAGARRRNDAYGGIGTHYRALVSALLRKGDRVTVLLVGASFPVQHEFDGAELVAVAPPRLGRLWFLDAVPLARRVRSALAAIGADVVFAPSGQVTWSSQSARPACLPS